MFKLEQIYRRKFEEKSKAREHGSAAMIASMRLSEANTRIVSLKHDAKLKQRLQKRPPVPFTAEEFEAEVEGNPGAAADELVEAVVRMCEHWIFVEQVPRGKIHTCSNVRRKIDVGVRLFVAIHRPINSKKWSFFLSYVVPLRFWEESERFSQLQSIASVANGALTRHVTRLLEDMAKENEHGSWILDELDHINGDQSIADHV